MSDECIGQLRSDRHPRKLHRCGTPPYVGTLTMSCPLRLRPQFCISLSESRRPFHHRLTSGSHSRWCGSSYCAAGAWRGAKKKRPELQAHCRIVIQNARGLPVAAERVGRHRANLMPTASYWLPSSINWRCNVLQPLPAHHVSKTMKPMTLPITYLMTYRLLWIRKPLLN